jgi:hypothetical protein
LLMLGAITPHIKDPHVWRMRKTHLVYKSSTNDEIEFLVDVVSAGWMFRACSARVTA